MLLVSPYLGRAVLTQAQLFFTQPSNLSSANSNWHHCCLCSYNPSVHSFNMLHDEMQSVLLRGDVADDTSNDNGGAFVIFLIGDLAAIEPLYGDYSFNFMMLEAGYITELLMDTASKQQIHLRECPPPEEDVDSCSISPELRTSFSLSDTHRLLHCLVGSSA